MRSHCRFRAETVIESGIGVVYAFHENPYNVGDISPAWQSVQVLQAEPKAKVGDSFHIRVLLFGLLPLNWKGIWREAECPYRLVDEMSSGPFAHWRHEHIFSVIDSSRTLMIDQIEYRFFGGWLGKLFGETLGRLQFRIMFADRHARTRRRLREQG